MLSLEEFVASVGEDEVLGLAGSGHRNDRTIDASRVIPSLDYAVSIVTGMISPHFRVPADGTPLLTGLAIDIARWHLRGRGGQSVAMNEVVQKRYDEAILTLQRVAKGQMRIDLEAANGGPVPDMANDRAVLGHMPASLAETILAGYGS